MAPEFKLGDCIIIDPDKKPYPGQLVLAYLKSEEKFIFRKYREREASSKGVNFELMPINSHWPTITLTSAKGMIVGTMVEHRRYE